jgi:PleD family two-component response regulator
MQQQESPHLAVLDWMMPGLDGVEVCSRVRRLEKEVSPYLILLTGVSDKKDLVRAFDAGADDYVTKPCDPDELRVRLLAGKRIVDLQVRLMAAQGQMRDQACRDGLTGLWRREEILQILRRELNRASRESSFVGVILIDVDSFKRINDTHGHATGDAVLLETSRRMLGVLRRMALT